MFCLGIFLILTGKDDCAAIASQHLILRPQDQVVTLLFGKLDKSVQKY